MKIITPQQNESLLKEFKDNYWKNWEDPETWVSDILDKCTHPRNLILELTAHIHTIGIPAESYVEKEQSETFSQGVEVMRKEILKIIDMLFYPERGPMP